MKAIIGKKVGMSQIFDENGHGNEIQLGIDLDDVQILDGDLIAAHLAGADLALEDTGGIGRGAHGTSVTMDGAAAVAGPRRS